MRRLTLVLCATLLVPCLGCRKLISKAVHKAQESHATSSAKGESGPTAQTLANAASLYAQGFNKMIGPLKQTIETYQREVPDLAQGLPKHRPVLIIGTADRDLDEVAKLYEKGTQATPASHADLSRMGDAALTAARAVRKEFAEAVRYYGAENYKDDMGEGGKAIDGRMRTSVEAYNAAIRKLQDRLGAIELEALERELKEIPPTAPGHHFRAVNLAAKRLVEGREQLDRIHPSLAAVKAANADLRKFSESRTDLPVAFKNYTGLVDQFEAQAIAFARDAQQPTKDARSLSLNTTLLVSRYNTLVQMGNSLYQLEDAGLLK